jgi:hypothetical protein
MYPHGNFVRLPFHCYADCTKREQSFFEEQWKFPKSEKLYILQAGYYSAAKISLYDGSVFTVMHCIIFFRLGLIFDSIRTSNFEVRFKIFQNPSEIIHKLYYKCIRIS